MDQLGQILVLLEVMRVPDKEALDAVLTPLSNFGTSRSHYTHHTANGRSWRVSDMLVLNETAVVWHRNA